MSPDDLVHALQRQYGVTPALGHILLLLVAKKRVTARHIEEEGIVTDARVALHRLRKVLAPHNIEIRSSYRMGYWLADEDREAVKSYLKVAA